MGEHGDPAPRGRKEGIARGKAGGAQALVEPGGLPGPVDAGRMAVGGAHHPACGVAHPQRDELCVQARELQDGRVASRGVERADEGPVRRAGEDRLLVGEEVVQLGGRGVGEDRDLRVRGLPGAVGAFPGVPGEQRRGGEADGETEQEELCAYGQAQGHRCRALRSFGPTLWGLSPARG